MSYYGKELIYGNFSVDEFTGDGTTTTFVLNASPSSTNAVLVWVNEVIQVPSVYTIVGASIIFTVAPPTTEAVLVRHLGSSLDIGTPPDGSISFPKLSAVIDDDTMTTATDTNIPTSESVKAYVDNNIVTGTYTTASLSVNATEATTITHGLGTDDVDFNFSIVGGSASEIDKVNVNAVMFDVDKSYIFGGDNSDTSTSMIGGLTPPSTGDIRFNISNRATVAQTVTVKYWVRKRA